MPNTITKGKAIAGQFSLLSGVMWMSGTGAPTDTVTGAGVAQKGSTYVRTSNGAIYYNTGTKASPVWSLVGAVGALAQHHIFVGNVGGVATDVPMTGDATIASTGAITLAGALTKYAEVTIASADILAVGAGKFGHADGYPLVVGPGAGKVIEFVSATAIYDQAVKAYTDGGDTSVNWDGGGVLSNLIDKTEFCAHNGDTVNLMQPVVVGDGPPLLINTGLNLVTTAAFTDTGVGAAGVVRVKVCYRIHATGL